MLRRWTERILVDDGDGWRGEKRIVRWQRGEGEWEGI
jgi:hypothetical protein